jgi:ABC-2 type transport system permease protein
MAAGAVGDSPLFLFDYALRLLRVLVLLGLWRQILAVREGSEDTGISLAALLTYTIVSEVFAEQLSGRTTLSEALWEGTLIMRFLRPMGLVRQLAAERLGLWVIHFCLFSVPLFLLAPLLGVDPRPISPSAGFLFAISLCLAILIGLAMELLFGAAVVAFEQSVWIVEWVRTAIATLLSGSLLPLALYPWGLGDLFSWLPFAAMAWAPLAIYTGLRDPWPLLVSQCFWVAALWPLANWYWGANREKLVAYGG